MTKPIENQALDAIDAAMLYHEEKKNKRLDDLIEILKSVSTADSPKQRQALRDTVMQAVLQVSQNHWVIEQAPTLFRVLGIAETPPPNTPEASVEKKVEAEYAMAPGEPKSYARLYGLRQHRDAFIHAFVDLIREEERN